MLMNNLLLLHRQALKLMAMLALGFSGVTASPQTDQMSDNPSNAIRVGQDQKQSVKVNDAIYQAIGFGNTFLVTTPAGNVIIDTSIAFNAARHKQLLTAVSSASIKYIILTHGHSDHTGGVTAWKQAGTQIIAQKNHVEFEHYLTRLGEYYARNNAAQFALATLHHQRHE